VSAAPDVRPVILVVDDNEQNRALVEATLEEEGHRVVLASNGEDALRAFDALRPDCVLLDVRMPGTDGLTVCRAIRTRAVGSETPVVFLTALRDVETFDEALQAGGDDFLTKPVRPNELLVRVQAALKLRRLTAENRDYHATIRNQRDAMMRLQLQKEQLMAFVVHDLKNPVSTLDLHAQLLLRDKSLSSSAQECARAIRNEAHLLIRQINNLLDLSKGDESELAAAPRVLELSELVREVQHSFELRASEKHVHVSAVLEPAHVHADPDLLRRMLENLLDNALRHAPPGSTVALGLEARADTVLLTVADQGAGVPASMREKVFERFVQADGGRAGQGSYGLGLAFCKLVVEQQGGRIWVDDGKPGALFSVSLQRVA
jgi:two-component system sensor histidine kinase/response regulator